MAKIETVPIRFKWLTSGADPMQFKPFGNQYEVEGVYIEINLPKKYLLETCTDGTIVISPAGMAFASHEITMAIRKSYAE
jgi:hypothetical protein